MCASLLVVALLLHAALAEPAPVCPEGCRCPHQLKADCSSQTFKYVPADLHVETRILNMSNNSISKLGNDTFAFGSLPYLKVLYLHHNNISRIHPHAFVALDNVRFVYLGRNKLQAIQRDIFISNYKLETLALNHNPLKFPQKGAFMNIPTLRDLDISFCNITSLYTKTFSSLRKVESLRMSHNLLSTLEKEVFLPLKSLKLLYLSNNNISTLEFDLFSSLKLLTLLDLSNNKLKELNHRVFSAQTSLRVLYLSYNNLSVVDEDEFHSLVSLEELYLQNNSLDVIEDNLFRSTINLNTLYLDNNKIRNLSKIALSKLNAVTNLYISGNRLETFNFRLVCELENVRHLRVFGNPLWCDCDMRDLWEWAGKRGVELWGSCVHAENHTTLDNSTAPAALTSLTCITTPCASEPLVPQTDSHLTLVYILSALCPLLLFALCFICAVLVFTRHRKNARELRNREYKANTSSTGYLILDTLPRIQQLYTSEQREQADTLQYLKKHQMPVIIENHHVSPYSVSPVLQAGACSMVSPVPPPVPARPPSDLILSTLPHCYPEGNAMRGAAFSTSEEEESRPLMKHYRTASATISKESSLGARQPRRVRPRRRHDNHSASDTEPWSSYSEGSGSVSITECEVAGWSGSEASTRLASEDVAENAHA